MDITDIIKRIFMSICDIYNWELIFRILFAGICGMLIGIERKNRSKEAGIRTHFMVSCGAALIMIVSKYAFFDMISDVMFNGIEVRLDPSRVASTIASGIGFLGAGMIFVHKNTITGLTTAAGIWATSGIGMAIGSGMYLIGFSVTLILLLAQVVLHLNSDKNMTKNRILVIKGVEQHDYQDSIEEVFKELEIKIHDISINTNIKEGIRDYIVTLEIPYSVKEETIVSKINYNSCIEVI